MTNTCNTKIHILYYIRKSKTRSNGTIPIYCRITVSGKRAEFSLNRAVEENRWNKSGMCLKGTKEDARTLNAFLENVRHSLRERMNF